MKFDKIEIIPVNIPMKAPIRWAWGVREGITRNIIRISFSNGIVGYGETMGGQSIVVLIQNLFKRLVGVDVSDFTFIDRHAQFLPYFHGYSGYAAVAGIEMAAWDALGKKYDQPLYQLLGGKIRSEIPFSAYVFYRYPSADNLEGGEESPEDIANYCQQIHDQYGFTVFKLKGGVFSPKTDVESLAAIRRAMGTDVKLRVDPNGVWSPETVLSLKRDFVQADLEYLEDPTWGLGAMARLRRDLPIPMATNMCVVEFDDIPLSVQLNAVDIVLGDLHKWGGIRSTQRLAAVLNTFRLGMSLHSGVELGLSTAANLHLAASIPEITYAVDSHYHHLIDDVLLGGMLTYHEGCMTVPEGPGLGVSIDPDRLESYHNAYAQNGALSGTYDGRQPNWIPDKQQW